MFNGLLIDVPEPRLNWSTICEELAKVKHKWWVIGMKLHICYHKLKEFEEKEVDPLAAVINYWLNGNVKDVPITWRSVATALESILVDESGLAQTIRDKYCPEGNDSHSCQPSCFFALNILLSCKFC